MRESLRKNYTKLQIKKIKNASNDNDSKISVLIIIINLIPHYKNDKNEGLY